MTINPEFLRQLAATGASAPSADNSQPGCMAWDGRTLSINHALRHPHYNVFGPDSHATLLSVGALIENLSAGLAANGMATDWHWGGSSGQPYASITLDHAPAHYTAPEGPALRHTNRHPYRRDSLPAGLAATLGAIGEGGNRAVLVQDRARQQRLVQLIRVCSEARFCSQPLHTWLFGSLRYTPAEIAQGDGLDINCLGLPPGGRQMMALISNWKRLAWLNRLGFYKVLAGAEMGLVAAAPGLLCLAGPANWRGSLDAGRLLASVWSSLNQQGIAVHPYYVVTDQISRLHDGTLAAGFDDKVAAAEREAAQLLELGQGERLHIILRIGYPKVDPVRSRRLPLDAVFRAT